MRAIRECLDHIERLLDDVEPNVHELKNGATPYTDSELLALLPAIEAQAAEAGVAVAMLRGELQHKLGKEPARGE